MIKHLTDFTIEELSRTICQFCLDNEMNLAEYLCPNCAKDNEKICLECCGCE